MKRVFLLLAILLCWIVLLGAVIEINLFLPQYEEGKSIRIRKDQDIFVFSESVDSISISALEKGTAYSFYEVVGNDVKLQMNCRYIDIDRSEIYQLQDGEKRKLSRQDLIELMRRCSSAGPVFEVDYSSASDVNGISYFDKFVDIQGEYEGRLQLTLEDPVVPKEETNLEEIEESAKTEHLVHVRTIIAAVSAALILMVPVFVMLRKNNKIMRRYILVVSVILIAGLMGTIQYYNWRT